MCALISNNYDYYVAWLVGDGDGHTNRDPGRTLHGIIDTFSVFPNPDHGKAASFLGQCLLTKIKVKMSSDKNICPLSISITYF